MPEDEENPFESSVDSGVDLDTTISEQIKEYQRILFILERDKELRAKQRDKLSRVTDKKSRKKEDHIKCNICFKILNLEDVKSCIICCNCRKAICRGGKCSIWIPNESGWECQLCSLSSESRSKASEWLHKQTNENCLSSMSAKSELSNSGEEHHSDIDTHSETLSSIAIDRKQKIREFIEDTLANMLGGSLDDVSVGPVFQNKEYLPLWETENCPGVSHVKLKRLVEKIIDDTLRLPELLDYSGVPGRSKNDGMPYFDPKKYQELLATAVLNKIVDSYNYEKKFDNTETCPNSDLDRNHNAVITTKDKSSSSSISSIEPRSDSSFSDPTIDVSRGDDLSPSNSCSNLYTDALNRNSTENETTLSNYLAEHKVPFPDLAIDSESASEDFVSVATSNGIESTWEDNWLFKKKKHGKDSPVSVGMLVPAPKEDIKALIGDKTTDEVSDLSEAGSDFDENECDLNANNTDFDPPNVRIQNKTVIGGKSPVGIFDELLEQTSLISSSSIPDGESAFTETKNDFVLGNDGLNDIKNVKLNLSKTNESTDNEAINSNVTSIVLQNSPPKILLEKNTVNKFDEPIIEPPEDFTDDEKALISTHKKRSSFSSNEGSIAEREHKKWYNAVEMPNNPYTQEAIKRRLSNSGSDKPIDIPNINTALEKATSDEKLNRPIDDVGPKSLQVVLGNNQPDYARYGRDYYINDAKQASGTRKRNQNMLDTSSPPESSTDSERINEKEVTQSNTSEELVHRSSSLGDKRSDSEDIFQARPVRVEESDPILPKTTKHDYLSTADRDFYLIANEDISSLKSSASTSLSQNSLTPSEDSDTIRVYDLNKQETRIIKDDKIKTIPKINTSEINKNRPNNLSFTSKNSVQLKAVTPTSLKFLQPKRKSFDPNRIMSLDSEITSTSPIFEGNIITPTNGTEISPSKPVIEEDVASALPSVKALAQVFLSNISSRTSTAVNRPKSASWQELDVKQCMEMSNATKNGDSINSEASRDSYVPPYDRAYCPIESPATPPVTPQMESLENNVEIIEQPLNEIPEKVEDNNDKLENIVTNPIEQTQLCDIVETPSSDRAISPVLVPGLLKNNIAFFENLKNK